MIGIIDYRINNIRSVINAVKFLGLDFDVVTNAEKLNRYKMLILPGVGAFDSGVEALQKNGIYDGLKNLDLTQTKLFGICLGMQLLCNASEEGSLPGLGLVPGNVIHLKNQKCNGKIPHVGFNTIKGSDRDLFLESMIGDDFYFVHSYSVATDCERIKTASCNYSGASVTAALQYGGVFATQFHPEKSGLKGLELIRRAYTC